MDLTNLDPKSLLTMATELLASPKAQAVIKACLIMLAGFVLSRLVGNRLRLRWLNSQHHPTAQRLSRYGILLVSLAWALQQLGIDLGVVLGAAGVLTVAMGFAAQTSASNLISGLFLMGEAPFQLDDIVRVEGVTGKVHSIELLSVRLRTLDNVLVRIPNETMLKSTVTNLTHFPIRRFDMQIGVAYKEDVAEVERVLLEAAATVPLCLEEPKPVVMFKGFGDSALDLQFCVWTARDHFIEFRTAMHAAVKRAFDAAGIEIPFPHLSLYAGSVTEPLPIRWVDSAPPQPTSGGSAAPAPPNRT